MNYEEYKAARESIMQHPEMVEIQYRPKLIDEYGEQQIAAKVDYVSPVGMVTHEYEYTGDTRNFALCNIIEYLTINGDIIQEVKQNEVEN